MQKSHIIVFSLILLVWSSLSAGKLDSFERNSLKEPGKNIRDTSQSHRSNSSDGFWAALLSIFFSSTSDDPMSVPTTNIESQSKEKREGDRTLPFFRLDTTIQNVESDVLGYGARLELGSENIGIHIDSVTYKENSPNDEMNISKCYLLYRLSNSPNFEADIGAGLMQVDGNEENSKSVVAGNLLIYPTDHFGCEIRTSLSENIDDYDVAVLGTYSHVSLKLGYRWTKTYDESLSGPYTGVSIYF